MKGRRQSPRPHGRPRLTGRRLIVPVPAGRQC